MKTIKTGKIYLGVGTLLVLTSFSVRLQAQQAIPYPQHLTPNQLKERMDEDSRDANARSSTVSSLYRQLDASMSVRGFSAASAFRTPDFKYYCVSLSLDPERVPIVRPLPASDASPLYFLGTDAVHTFKIVHVDSQLRGSILQAGRASGIERVNRASVEVKTIYDLQTPIPGHSDQYLSQRYVVYSTDELVETSHGWKIARSLLLTTDATYGMINSKSDNA